MAGLEVPELHNNLFDFALDNGIIDELELKALYDKTMNAKYLEKHFGKDYTLTVGKDGRYFTRLPNGKQVRKKNVDDFITEIVDYYKHAHMNDISVKQESTIEDVYQMWIDFKRQYDGITKATYDRLGEDYQRFFTNNPFASDILLMNMNEITEDDLEFFIRNTIKSFNLDSKSWAKLRSLVKGIWLYGLKINATPLYITKFFDTLSIRPKTLRQRVEKEEEQVFTDEEVQLIFKEIEREGYTPTGYGIILCFYTGMRAGELAGLMWEDVSEDYLSINVNHMEVLYKDEDGVRNKFEVVNHAKTVAGIRKVIVPDAYVPFFKTLKLKNNGEYVFTNNHGKRLHARNFSDKLYRMCLKLNIPPKRMHKIRKTVCSKLCDNGVDNRLLLKQIGHTDRRTTETFYHRDRRTDKEKREILNRVISY